MKKINLLLLIPIALAGLFAYYFLPVGHNPSYSELQAFIASDTVHLTQASPEYTCFNFTMDMVQEANKRGIRAYPEVIKFSDGEGHGIVAFHTVDKGIIYIEPQTLREITLAIGGDYTGFGYVYPLSTIKFYFTVNTFDIKTGLINKIDPNKEVKK